ncbi:MAG: hypothetical protein ACAH83_07955 [Alphaproteobacteria bacterium]
MFFQKHRTALIAAFALIYPFALFTLLMFAFWFADTHLEAGGKGLAIFKTLTQSIPMLLIVFVLPGMIALWWLPIKKHRLLALVVTWGAYAAGVVWFIGIWFFWLFRHF